MPPLQQQTGVGPLAGIVVLDATDDVAGLYAGQLIADLGADVYRLDDDRLDSAARPPDRAWLLRNRLVLPAASAPGGVDGAVRSALRGSHVLLARRPAAETHPLLGETESRRIQPTLVRATISPFGLDSPWSERAGDDLIVQALAGAMEVTGEPGRAPIRMGAPVLAMAAGTQAVLAVLACLLESPGGSPAAAGRTIDVSLLDVSLSMLSYLAPLYLTLGRTPARVGSGHPTIYPYNSFEVADGYLVVAPFTGRFWRNFCRVLDAPEWAEDERFRGFQQRLDNRSVLEPLLNERMRTKTRADWLALLEAGDVPCGSVNDVNEALQMDQTEARDLVVGVEPAPGGKPARAVAMPLAFTYADASRYAPRYRAPRQAPGWPAPVDRGPAAEPDGPRRAPRPLAGVRVVDLTRMAAGPFCTEMLADLGADVVKVEEPKIGDPTRRNVPAIGGLSSYFLAFNRGKRSVSVDMKTREGRSTVLDLLATADVVVENFRPGVMKRLGLDYETVRAVNDRIVFVSISGFGQTGPLRLKISFDLVNQAIAGLLSVTGEPGRPPIRLGLPIGDLAGGQFAALAAVAGLLHRRASGRGACVDVSLHDVLLTVLGDVAQRCLATGQAPTRLGSAYEDRVPAAVFPTSDGYLALEAWTEAAWQDLLGRLNCDALRDARYDAAGRLAHRQEVEGIVTEALAGRTTEEWVSVFDGSAVGAAAVLDIGAALDSGHASARGLVVDVALPSGEVARTVGSAFRIDGWPLLANGGPPGLGDDNDAVFETVAAGSAAPVEVGE